jgi:hypothetical protein
MSRTAVDLPDPLQAQGGGGIPENADDLLAQLASEEVDRLLSEADEAPIGSIEFSTSDAAAPDAASPSSDAGEASLNELFNELDDDQIPTLAEDVPPPPSAPQVVVAPPAAAAPLDTPGLTAMRQQADAPAPDAASSVPASAADALAAEMEEDERAHAAALRRMKQGETTPPLPTPDAAPVPPPSSEAPAVPAPAPVATAAPAPDQAAPTTATTAITIDPQALEDSGPAEPGVPLLVCVLEWINAPLDGLSESLRGAIGKVALVTTFNALGVLLYVLFFRHR